MSKWAPVMTSSSDTSTNTGIRHRKPRAGERTRGSVDAMQTKFAVGVQNLDHEHYLEQLQANIDELPDAAGADAAFIALISEDGEEIETVFASSSGFAQCKPGQLAGEKLSAAEAVHRQREGEAITEKYARRAVIGALAAITPGSDLIIQAALATRLIGATAAAALLDEANAVLDADALAPLFAPEALAEVDITGQLHGVPCSGTIDRLVIASDHVLAVDFKSNAIVPDTPEAVPEGLLRQMGAYAAMLAPLYPNHRVETALLWTRSASLMMLPPALTQAALSRAAHEGVIPPSS